MNKIKSLMYAWEFPPNISGGLGIATHGIVNGLIENEVDLSLVLPCERQANNETIKYIKKDCKYTPNQITLLPTRVYNAYEGHDDLVNEVLHFADLAGSKAQSIPHDIIHAHDWLSGLAGIKAKKISGKRLVIHIHSLESDRGGIYYNERIHLIEKNILAEADLIIAVSHYTKQSICQHYAIHPDKIKVVHNGIHSSELKHYSPSHVRNNWILFLGRITHQKGPFYFLEAAQKLISLGHDAEFIISGSGDQWHDLIMEVAKRRIRNRIHFTGFLSREKVKLMYSQCKLYVMPSVSEPFGLTALEALANEVPVIVSNKSGVKEVLPHLSQVDPSDTDELAKQMDLFLKNKILAEGQLEEAWRILPTLTWTNAGKKIKQIYQKIL